MYNPILATGRMQAFSYGGRKGDGWANFMIFKI